MSASGAAPAGVREEGPGNPLAGVVFGVLVVACIGAFFLTQHLKHSPTAVQQFRATPFFSPYPRGHLKVEAISFKLEHPDEVTVTVIDSSGNTVATLVRNYPVQRYKTFSLRWNGRRGTARTYEHLESETGRPILLALSPGRIAPAGEYRAEVTLRHEHKTVRSPNAFTLVAE